MTTAVTSLGRAGRIRGSSRARVRQEPVTLAPAVWKSFASRWWERQAGCLPGVLPESLISPATAFDALVAVGDRYRAGVGCDDVCFWVGGAKTAAFGDLLPRARHGSLDAWAERTRRELRGDDFTLLVANPHCVSGEVWDISRVFLRGLLAETGVPCGGADSTFFIGRYRRTPFGVHRGQMSVMTFPIAGEKRFRVWPRGYGEAHPEIDQKVDYPEHLPASEELIGTPQDVLYWPADVWHIAEGGEELTCTFNVGFWWDRPPLTRVLFELSRQLAEAFPVRQDDRASFAPSGRIEGSLDDFLADGVRDALATLRAVAAGGEAHMALALNAMRMLSADGFRDIPDRPAPTTAPLQPGDAVQRRAVSRVLFAPGGSGSLWVAADGHLHEAPDAPAIRTALRTIQQGETVTVTETTRDLLDWLVAGQCAEIAGRSGHNGGRRRRS